MSSLAERKSALRAERRAHRKTLGREAPHIALVAAQALLRDAPELPSLVALYSPVGSELDTNPLAEELVTRGIRIALPEVVSQGSPLIFRDVTGPDGGIDDLRLYKDLSWAPIVDPALVFTPLIAFDRRGYRLGQGGGFYDRTLCAGRQRPSRPRYVGLAYAGQEIEEVPTDAHDQKLDGVLTERGYLPFL